MAKKKLLPKDFEDLLKRGDLAELQAVFATCDVNARGGPGKQSALAFDRCPDALARWLVANGADLSATDTWGSSVLHTRAFSLRSGIDVLLELGADVRINSGRAGTPLHATARSCNVANARALIERGAEVDALDAEGQTPLELALRTCSNITLVRAVPFGRKPPRSWRRSSASAAAPIDWPMGRGLGARQSGTDRAGRAFVHAIAGRARVMRRMESGLHSIQAMVRRSAGGSAGFDGGIREPLCGRSITADSAVPSRAAAPRGRAR